MNTTPTTDWQVIILTRDDHKEYSQRIPAGIHLRNAVVKREVLMSGDGELGIVIVQDVLVEVSVESDPANNCVGVDLQWAKVGDARVRFVGNWGDVRDFVSAEGLKTWDIDRECADEALSVMRSLCRD